MKKIILIITIILLMLLLGIFMLIRENPDFAPYTQKAFDKVYNIESDVYDLVAIKNETTKIAQNYENDIRLTYIRYDIENAGNSQAIFQFYKADSNGKNQACIINITVDLNTKQTTNITYEKGHGKRVTGYSDEINDMLNENILDYIDETTENISIIVTNSDISKIDKSNT